VGLNVQTALQVLALPVITSSAARKVGVG
jgi:hypothetical protein